MAFKFQRERGETLETHYGKIPKFYATSIFFKNTEYDFIVMEWCLN